MLLGRKLWYENRFSKQELLLINQNFKPLGIDDKDAGVMMLASESAGQLGILVGHLKKENLREIGYAILAHADELNSTQTAPLLERHFYFSSRGEYYYRWRDIDEFALDEAIASFNSQIAIAQEVATFFMNDKNWGFIPAHAGYRQMRIIEEKRHNYDEAIRLCKQAKLQGWKDDWDEQIIRIEKKKEKSSTQT